MITVYHGSTENLEIVGRGHCVSATPDYPQKFALGKIPGSKGYAKSPGWIYVLQVRPDQLEKQGLDYILTEDIVPTDKIDPLKFKAKSATEVLYGGNETV